MTETGRDHNITIRISPALKQRIETAARCGHRKPSNWARIMLEQACDVAEAEQRREAQMPPCVCKHPKSDHRSSKDLGGTQCLKCPGDSEESWRHAYRPYIQGAAA